MNEQTIEKLLQKAPPVRTPAGLRKDLQANIELPRCATTHHGPRITNHVFRRWLPTLGFALWFLGCVVVFGLQASRIAELKRANESRQSSLASVEQNQAVQDRAQWLAKELEQLRKDAADVQRLRAEAELLRAQAQEVATLREQNQQLRAELKSQATPPPKPEEDFIYETANRRARTKCINNLKQVGLAARLWAHETKTDAMPNRWSDMIDHLGGPERALKYVGCPGVAPYEILSFGAPETDPTVVFVRCVAHNIVGLVDGSVQQLGDKASVIQKDGKWVFTRVAE
ncbi:MAG TPA: hypothetical protein VNT99_20055 [Methylomirabilota bacterium]|nr:hypothetical protein [Methylomirabilota bacterium]